MPSFSFKVLRQHLPRRNTPPSQDPATKIPLTERNIEFFNNDGKVSDTVSEFETDSSNSDARLKIQRSREVQISEWLRLVPSVSPPSPATKLTSGLTAA